MEAPRLGRESIRPSGKPRLVGENIAAVRQRADQGQVAMAGGIVTGEATSADLEEPAAVMHRRWAECARAQASEQRKDLEHGSGGIEPLRGPVKPGAAGFEAGLGTGAQVGRNVA